MLRECFHGVVPGRLIVVRRAVTRLFGDRVSPATFWFEASTMRGSMRSLGVHPRMSHSAMSIDMLSR